MRLHASLLSKLTSLMLGGAWAIVLIGATSVSIFFLKINLFIAILSAFLGAMPGLLIVLFLEYLVLKSEKLAEMEKQTALMQKILENIAKEQ